MTNVNMLFFSGADLATKYKENGKTDDACFIQDTPVSKDAKTTRPIDQLVCNLVLGIYGLVSKVKTGL
jgi:hypothetical protein